MIRAFMRESSATSSGLVMTTKCHGWRPMPLGANVPASTTFSISDSATGSAV